MYLTISKRFEFSASRRYYQPAWSPEKNYAAFGKDAAAQHGSGQNYVAYLVFSGPVDITTGMVINVVTIKELVGRVINSRYDHKFLNLDTPPFDRVLPTPENMARNLLAEVVPLFKQESAQPVACHVQETEWREATAFTDGSVHSHYSLEFSAARRTCSPHMSDEQNRELFGIAAAPGGHGHRYRLRLTLKGEVDGESGMICIDRECRAVLGELHRMLDHRNLNQDVPELAGLPMTTECLSRFLYRRLAESLPVMKVRLDETPDFYAEYNGGERFLIGVTDSFNAAHRLDSPHLSERDNRTVFGKCNNPSGHGHLYRVEAAASGPLDERSGTVFPLASLQSGLSGAIEPWDHRHLNLDTTDFVDSISTSENIINVLWPRLDRMIGGSLWRLRLWETLNNRFTLRREPGV